MDAKTPCLAPSSRCLPRLALALALACASLPAFAQHSPARADGVPADFPPVDRAVAPAAAIDAAEDGSALQPGEFLWMPERGGDGQLVIVVSLPTQLAHVYRNGVRIGLSTISSGKPGKETPTGTFEILQKKRMHRSNLYNNAPMPYMQRLTWDGIALHAGKLPGYPASHGCIRLPHAFAQKLYEATERGMLVVIADEASHGTAIIHPGERAPVDAYSGLPLAPGAAGVEVASAAP